MINKAIGSKVMLDDFNDPTAAMFYDCMGDLLGLEDVLNLDNFCQHLNTSRLQHSVNVAYYSFLISRKFGCDYRSAARAGLLHDLFLYDWRDVKQPEGNHAFAHPVVALRNARKNTEINHIEEDAILKHMWPLAKKMPRYKESFLVSLADKYCTCREVGAAIAVNTKDKFRNALASHRHMFSAFDRTE